MFVMGSIIALGMWRFKGKDGKNHTVKMSENTISLPEAFKERMRKLLGGEYEEFIESYERTRAQGLRVNPLKIRGDEMALEKLAGRFHLNGIPWVQNGFYYDGETRPGRHPFHEAGVYYIQEPSAMAVAELLDARPGQRILDLCAAPGGKTTQLAGHLMGEGLLVSNEIHPARAKILSQNVERMGIGNCVVTNADSGTLSRYFPEFFDGIVVDAPCSGEGMFRKDEEARGEWSPDNVLRCADRQREILDEAAKMLRPGGRLVYSTCTFAPEENEGSVGHFLLRHPEFSVEKVEAYPGFSSGRPDWADDSCQALVGEDGENPLNRTLLLWPHRLEGEGHFAAVLRKAGNQEDGDRKDFVSNREYPKISKKMREMNAAPYEQREGEIRRLWQEFCRQTGISPEACSEIEQGRLMLFGEQVYLLPPDMPDCQGLKILRPGLHLGTVKKDRLEPSHALALYLHPSQVVYGYAMDADGPETAAYLRGESLTGRAEGFTAGGERNGWVLMAADGYSIGWAKQVGTILKNHYPKGLRKPY